MSDQAALPSREEVAGIIAAVPKRQSPTRSILSAYALGELKTDAEHREAIDYEAIFDLFVASMRGVDSDVTVSRLEIEQAALGIGETDD